MDAYIDLLFCEFNLYTQFNIVFFELQLYSVHTNIYALHDDFYIIFELYPYSLILLMGCQYFLTSICT